MSEEVLKQPLMEVEKVLAILDRISIFGGLTEAQLNRMLGHLRRVQYLPGESIFCEGDSASYIYVVESGRVKLVFDVAGEQHLKAELEPGTCFGETSLIGIQPHSATTIAMEPTELLLLSRDSLDDIYTSDKELFALLILNIARESCRRLSTTNRQLRSCLVQLPEAAGDGILHY